METLGQRLRNEGREEGKKIGYEEGEKKGEKKAKLKTAKELIKRGVDKDYYCRCNRFTPGKDRRTGRKDALKHFPTNEHEAMLPIMEIKKEDGIPLRKLPSLTLLNSLTLLT